MNSPVVSIDGYQYVPFNDEDALLKAVANQPVSVTIDASGDDFQLYSEVKFTRYKSDWRQLRVISRLLVLASI